MRRLLVALSCVTALALLGCEGRQQAAPGEPGGPGVKECEEAGQRCKLPGGGLGVCTAAVYHSDDPSKSPEGPAFVCMSQH